MESSFVYTKFISSCKTAYEEKKKQQYQGVSEACASALYCDRLQNIIPRMTHRILQDLADVIRVYL